MGDIIDWQKYLKKRKIPDRHEETHEVLTRYVLDGIAKLPSTTPVHEVAVELCRQVGCAVTNIWPPEEWEEQAVFFGDVVTALIIAAKEDYDDQGNDRGK